VMCHPPVLPEVALAPSHPERAEGASRRFAAIGSAEDGGFQPFLPLQRPTVRFLWGLLSFA